MELSAKYKKMLARLKDEPEYKQKTAEKRLKLIVSYLLEFENAASKRAAGRFSRRQAIIKFSASYGLCPTTFTIWLNNYTAKGVKGLVPDYGKHVSSYEKSILPIVAEIINPEDSPGQTYRRLLLTCSQLSIQVPSQKTVQRMLIRSGLIRAENKRGHKVVMLKVTLDMDPGKPLLSLQQLVQFIRDSDFIPIQTKEESVKQLTKFLSAVSRQKPLVLSEQLTQDELVALAKIKSGPRKRKSSQATAILMANRNATLADIVRVTGRHSATVINWVKLFNQKRMESMKLVAPHRPERDKHIEERRVKIIDILHTPPSTYGVNRTAWNYDSIAKVYLERYGEAISVKTVGRAVMKSGYSWRHARKVLTSPDPEYKTKIAKVLETIRGLKPDEAFFFVDEAGPYRVKMYGGKALSTDEDIRKIPERQKPRGKVQFIAALEIQTNQVTYRFIKSKGTDSVLRLLVALRQEYGAFSKLFLCWDAVSTHDSGILRTEVAQYNVEAQLGHGPFVEVVPLPSRSQFLNVIESVLSGMKRAVIHNSDYPSAEIMEEAISIYFDQRNRHFQDNPARAGNKIWDKERFDLNKLAGGLFRRM